MRYMEAGLAEAQRKPLVPNKIISGMLPGATQIRIGGDDGILIDGKNRVISVNNGDASVSIGKTTPTTLGTTFVDDTGIPRFHAGVYPDGSVKIKLSQTGADVYVATDDQLIWSSDFNSFKIVDTIDLEVTLNHTSGSTGSAYGISSIGHELTFMPSILGMTVLDPSFGVVNPITNWANPAISYGFKGTDITLFCIATVSVDIDNLYFDVIIDPDTATGTYVFTTKVYLLRETFTA